MALCRRFLPRFQKATVGAVLEAPRARRTFARVMALVMLGYALLDLRTSDSALGNHLYLGARSLVPPVIDAGVFLLFLHLGLCASAPEATPESPPRPPG